MRAHEFIYEDRGVRTNLAVVNEIKKLWDEGWEISDIAELMNLSRNSVADILKNHYSERKRRIDLIGRRLTDSDKQEILSDFLSGMNFEQIGKKFNITRNFVQRIIKPMVSDEYYNRRIGINIVNADSRQKGTTKEQKSEITHLYRLGNTLEEIGKKFNLSQTIISRIIRMDPDFEKIKQDNYNARILKKKSKQALTKRMINKPHSKGISAIRRTGSPSGSSF